MIPLSIYLKKCVTEVGLISQSKIRLENTGRNRLGVEKNHLPADFGAGAGGFNIGRIRMSMTSASLPKARAATTLSAT